MPNVFASCDLVVDASWAGTGITGTIREAMAMEKPVIATDAGGNRELVSSPEVGWLIPMKDRAALTGALLEVIGDPRAQRGRREGRAGARRAGLLEGAADHAAGGVVRGDPASKIVGAALDAAFGTVSP